MILGRVTQHVKQQNWFAVFIDFLIVVAGILIAFQVTSWHESLQDRTQERKIIERLINDFTALTIEVDEKIAFLESANSKVQFLDRLIIDGPADDAVEQLHDFFATAFSLPGMVGQSDTYQQLIASGDMNLLTNNTLQEELVAHATLTQTLLGTGQAVREWSRPYITPIVRLSFLINAQPLEQAVSKAGSEADLIVAIGIYKQIFKDQLNRFRFHKESFSTINELLKIEGGS